VIVTRTLAALVAVLMLSLSLSSAICDGSCALSQPQANESTQMSMEMMDHEHCDHVAAGVPGKHSTIQAVSSCPDHRCGDTAILRVQKLSPAPPQLRAAALMVVAQSEQRDIVSVTGHSPTLFLAFVRPDTPTTSLRI
jgi:hypothetical protein